MDETFARDKAAARRWTWRIPGYVLLPFYLMLIGLALRYGHHCYVMETGEVVKDGASAEMADDPAIAKAYLGG